MVAARAHDRQSPNIAPTTIPNIARICPVLERDRVPHRGVLLAAEDVYEDYADLAAFEDKTWRELAPELLYTSAAA